MNTCSYKNAARGNYVLDEYEREYGPVYNYMPYTDLAGVRDHSRVPNKIHMVRGLDDPISNYVREDFGMQGIDLEFIIKVVVFVLIVMYVMNLMNKQ